MSALESPEAIANGWTLAPRSHVLPEWPRRGRIEHVGGKNQAVADSVICCEPGVDRTNGFFVSCFIRGAQAEVEQASRKRTREEQDGVLGDSSMKRLREDDTTVATTTQAKKKNKNKKKKKTNAVTASGGAATS